MAKKSKQKVRGGKRATQVKTDVDLKDETSENGEEEQQQEQWDMIEFVRGKRPDLICRSDGCEAMAVSIWKSNLKINSDDEWPTCEGCQDEHFGGWPEDFDPESPLVADGTEQDAAERQEPMTQPDTDANTNTRASDESPTEPQSIEVQQPSIDDNTKDGECDATDNDESKAEEVLWDLKKIMSIAEVTHECPIKCSHETCSLPAASIWVSTEKPTDNWYSCLDCQENDFGGWPEDLADIPVSHMTHDHRQSLQDKCSKYKDTVMPVFLDSPGKGTLEISQPHTYTVTPLPLSGDYPEKQTGATGLTTVTPNIESTSKARNDTSVKSNSAPKPSKAQLEIHRKWQAAAEAAGGPGARIVLSKPIAKKIIYDSLYNAFRPMNITEIHKDLKAVIPSPVLKACLDDMALDTESSSQFADSDDDDDGAPTKKPKKKTSDGPDVDMYKSALSFKAGKGSNTSLYYVNYNTAKSGDGLDFDQKHKLAADIAAAECEEKSLKHLLTTTRLATEKLLTEPKNDELNNRLLESEVEMTDLLDKICAARKLTVNEAHKTNTKKRIEHYAAFWRKRRRICMDFLFLMEETSDGLISAKKCLAGDGPIDCESDELIAKNVVAFGKSKRANVGGLKATFANTAAKSVTGVPPSDGFVAMLMDSKGTLKRVYLDEPVTAPK